MKFTVFLIIFTASQIINSASVEEEIEAFGPGLVVNTIKASPVNMKLLKLRFDELAKHPKKINELARWHEPIKNFMTKLVGLKSSRETLHILQNYLASLDKFGPSGAAVKQVKDAWYLLNECGYGPARPEGEDYGNWQKLLLTMMRYNDKFGICEYGEGTFFRAAIDKGTKNDVIKIIANMGDYYEEDLVSIMQRYFDRDIPDDIRKDVRHPFLDVVIEGHVTRMKKNRPNIKNPFEPLRIEIVKRLKNKNGQYLKLKNDPKKLRAILKRISNLPEN